MEQLLQKSYMTNGLFIYGVIFWAFPHILGSPSLYMTLQLLHSEFLIYEENPIFFFISVVNKSLKTVIR